MEAYITDLITRIELSNDDIDHLIKNSKHNKEDGICIWDRCINQATSNYIGETKPLFCSDCALKTMIMIKKAPIQVKFMRQQHKNINFNHKDDIQEYKSDTIPDLHDRDIPYSNSENQNKERSNLSFTFTRNNICYKDGYIISLKKMKDKFNAYIDHIITNKDIFKVFDHSEILKIDDRIEYKFIYMCKSCDKKHKKGCCSKYSKYNSIKKWVFINCDFRDKINKHPTSIKKPTYYNSTHRLKVEYGMKNNRINYNDKTICKSAMISEDDESPELVKSIQVQDLQKNNLEVIESPESATHKAQVKHVAVMDDDEVDIDLGYVYSTNSFNLLAKYMIDTSDDNDDELDVDLGYQLPKSKIEETPRSSNDSTNSLASLISSLSERAVYTSDDSDDEYELEEHPEIQLNSVNRLVINDNEERSSNDSKNELSFIKSQLEKLQDKLDHVSSYTTNKIDSLTKENKLLKSRIDILEYSVISTTSYNYSDISKHIQSFKYELLYKCKEREINNIPVAIAVPKSL